MTNHKWIDFAGFLNGCIHQLNHPQCPYKKYAQMDQYQRLEALLQISDKEATKMMKTCYSQQTECHPVLIPKKESSWEISVLV